MMHEDLEDRLRALRPSPAPDRLLEAARRGETVTGGRRRFDLLLPLAAAGLLAGLVWLLVAPSSPDVDPAQAAQELLTELKGVKHRLVSESNRDGNWELYIFNADGSNPVNLTLTSDVDELYPKVSPDGTKIVFCADEKKGEGKIRNLYVMNVDGSADALLATGADK